jgi:hypothetical protein
MRCRASAGRTASTTVTAPRRCCGCQPARDRVEGGRREPPRERCYREVQPDAAISCMVVESDALRGMDEAVLIRAEGFGEVSSHLVTEILPR